METKFTIEVPFFAGFYESILENSDTEYYAINEEIDYIKENYNIEISEDDIKFDYKARRKDICNNFIALFKDACPDFVESAEYDSMTSPKDYRFSIDRLYANIVLSENWFQLVTKFMLENTKWLEARIKEDWTSCDGFMSFMSTDIDKWFENISTDERYLSTILGYMLYFNDKDVRDNLNIGAIEDLYDSEYLSYSDELNEKIDFANKVREANKLQLNLEFED